MKKLLLLFFSAAVVFNAAAAKIAIGSKINGIPSPNYLDGQTRNFKKLLDKKYCVIYLWKPNQAALGDFARIAGVFDKFKTDVNFVGIGSGNADILKKFPGAVRLGFPMNSDPKGAALETWGLADAILPLCLLLDKNGTLLWRGKTPALPGQLKKCLSGKFNLVEEIRLDKFSSAVNAEVKAGRFDEAYKLLYKEWSSKKEGTPELVAPMISLLTKKLNRYDDAFKLLHEAQKKSSRTLRWYEMEYRMLGEKRFASKEKEFFDRVRKVFANSPGVLMAFAIAETKRPLAELDMKNVLSLLETGWCSNGFKTDQERGFFAIEYAKVFSSIGRNDLAMQMARTAYKYLKDDKKHGEGIKQAVIYYNRMLQLAPAVKIPDLKNK